MKAIVYTMEDCIACEQVQRALIDAGVPFAVDDLAYGVDQDGRIANQLQEQGGAAPVVVIEETVNGNLTRRTVEPKKVIAGLIG